MAQVIRVLGLAFWAGGCLCALAGVQERITSSVTLAWDRNLEPEVVSYNLYWGELSRFYTSVRSVGDTTQATISGLFCGANYFFAVTAVNGLGFESDYSLEVSYVVPFPSNNNEPDQDYDVVSLSVLDVGNLGEEQQEPYSGLLIRDEAEGFERWVPDWLRAVPSVPVFSGPITSRAPPADGLCSETREPAKPRLSPLSRDSQEGALHLSFPSWLPGQGSALVASATPRRAYVLESSANLMSWTVISTNLSGPDGKLYFYDPASAKLDQRFYRIRSLAATNTSELMNPASRSSGQAR